MVPCHHLSGAGWHRSPCLLHAQSYECPSFWEDNKGCQDMWFTLWHVTHICLLCSYHGNVGSLITIMSFPEKYHIMNSLCSTCIHSEHIQVLRIKRPDTWAAWEATVIAVTMKATDIRMISLPPIWFDNAHHMPCDGGQPLDGNSYHQVVVH